MSKVNTITRESWILNTFPEWGSWLNEEIEQERVAPGTFAMWWLGCTGIWLKSEGGTNVCVDFWCGTGKQSHGNPLMKTGHQMQRMAGVKKLQPNLRTTPFVLDPFAIRQIDAVLATHDHNDHIDVNVAAAVMQNCADDVALGSYGENPRGITDKMTSADILRMAESLNTKVVIPFHHDIWSNFQADPQEIRVLWEMKKDRLKYGFKPFIWQVGGKFTWPLDKDNFEYHYPRGFDDCFTIEPDLPFKSFL